MKCDFNFLPLFFFGSAPQAPHQPQEAVYGVTREEMAGCDVAQGLLLDITPLPVDGKMLLALYDKDLSDGDNFLVSEYKACDTAEQAGGHGGDRPLSASFPPRLVESCLEDRQSELQNPCM